MKNKNLHNIKSTGFKIPENYFEKIEDDIFLRLAEEKLSANIGSGGFMVPKDYFETLDAKILMGIQEKERSKVIALFDWKKIAYLSGMAASLILAFSLLFTNSNNLGFDDLETASIENYLLNENFNAYEIVPLLGVTELNSYDFMDKSMNASDIEDYLLQNSDVEQLIKEQ